MAHLAQFPWANTARVVALRFREDRLGQTAGSLTFTTLIALVPFVTVALDRKSTRLNSSHMSESRMPSSA